MYPRHLVSTKQEKNSFAKIDKIDYKVIAGVGDACSDLVAPQIIARVVGSCFMILQRPHFQ